MKQAKCPMCGGWVNPGPWNLEVRCECGGEFIKKSNRANDLIVVVVLLLASLMVAAIIWGNTGGV